MTARRHLAAFLLLALLAGCGGAPAPQQLTTAAPTAADAQLATAARAVANGQPAAAVLIYEPLAARGNGAAQVALANLLLRGAGIVRNPPRAIDLLQQAIASNVTEAARILGDVYLDGDGVPTDRERALQLYRLAAAQGDDVAKFRLASAVLEDPDAEAEARRLAVEEVRRTARAGIVQAQLALGELYADGRLGRRDPIEAARWYAVALEPLRAEANAGDPQAQERVGDMHRDGKGTLADGRAALGWYERAAANGRLPAVMRLARIHEKGATGLEPNPVQAVRWLQLAAEQGDRTAIYDLARRTFQGDGVLIDRAAALEQFQLAAEAGETRAFRWIGEILEEPDSGSRYTEAAEWYLRAAGTGDGKAMFKLAELHEKARLGPADPVEALVWYQLASEHGYERGAERVARLDRKLEPREKQRAAVEVIRLRSTVGKI